MGVSDQEVLSDVVRTLTGTLWSCLLKLRDHFSEQDLLDILPDDFPADSLFENESKKGSKKKHRRRSRKIEDIPKTLESDEKIDEIHKSKSADQISASLGFTLRKNSSESPRPVKKDSMSSQNPPQSSSSSSSSSSSTSSSPTSSIISTTLGSVPLSPSINSSTSLVTQTTSTPVDDPEKLGKENKYERSIREFKKSRSTTSPHLKGLVRSSNGSGIQTNGSNEAEPPSPTLPNPPAAQQSSISTSGTNGSSGNSTTVISVSGGPSTSSGQGSSNSSSSSGGSRVDQIVPSLSLTSNSAEPVKRLKGKNFNPFVNKRKKGDIHDGTTAHFLESRPDLLNYKKDLKNLPIVKTECSNIIFSLAGPNDDDCFHSGTSDDSIWACCLSTYPLKPSGQREGSPVCDYFKITDLDDRIIISLCDGCNWGKNVREGAEKASASFTQYLMSQMGSIRTTHDIGHVLLTGLSKCHSALVDYNNKRKNANSATCTLLGGLLTRAHLSTKEVGWVFTGLNLGDCKAYHYSNKQRTFTDITASNRLGSKDPSDPGGRIGSPTEDADLRNLELIQVVCDPEDLIIFVSDGVHDNLDPELLAVAPSSIDLEETIGTWKELSLDRASELKENFVKMLLKRLLISELASSFLCPGESNENLSTRLPEPVIKERRSRIFQPVDSCPVNFHFENPTRDRSESSQQTVHRSTSNEGSRSPPPPPDDIPYPAELSRPGTAQIGEASLEDIFQSKGINSQDLFSDQEQKRSPKTAHFVTTSGLTSSGKITLDCCNKWGPNLSPNEEVTYLKGLSTKVVSSALVSHAARTTQTSRTFMETRSDRLPNNYKDYPGKMDHTTCITIRIPHLPKS